MPSLLLELLDDADAAADVAGRAEADGDDVLALRLEGEGLVERQDAEDLGLGDAEVAGDGRDGRRRDVPELGLETVEDGDQVTLAVARFCNDVRRMSSSSWPIFSVAEKSESESIKFTV